MVQTRVVDDEGRDVAAGELGEIVHRSPHATLGYWRDPEKTAEAFARRVVPLAATSAPSTTRATSRSSTARRT